MESVVAALLRDFENGKLARRQLVQTLALMAVGSPVASAVAQSVATAPAKPAGTPWKTVWLDHISFQVSDHKKSVDFYTDLMGWKVLNDTGSQAMIDINGIGGIIIRNRRRPADGANAAAVQQPAQPTARPDSTTGAAPGPMAQGSRPPVTGVVDHISSRASTFATRTGGTSRSATRRRKSTSCDPGVATLPAFGWVG